jgi:hypothetical protein
LKKQQHDNDKKKGAAAAHHQEDIMTGDNRQHIHRAIVHWRGMEDRTDRWRNKTSKAEACLSVRTTTTR